MNDPENEVNLAHYVSAYKSQGNASQGDQKTYYFSDNLDWGIINFSYEFIEKLHRKLESFTLSFYQGPFACNAYCHVHCLSEASNLRNKDN